MKKTKQFNQLKYIQQYNKEHYRTFKVDLKSDEFDELNIILKKNKISKAQFLRDSIKRFKEGEK